MLQNLTAPETGCHLFEIPQPLACFWQEPFPKAPDDEPKGCLLRVQERMPLGTRFVFGSAHQIARRGAPRRSRRGALSAQHGAQIQILFRRAMEEDARGFIASVQAAHVEIVDAAELLE